MKRPALLISACLAGSRCRYNADAAAVQELSRLAEKYALVPVCPEILGGLPTPREPSEIRGGRVLSKSGADVTENFERGADEAARLAALCGCECALLKERSPSCGCGAVYDGTFSGTLTAGDGVLVRKLRASGIRIFGETEAAKLL